MENLRKQTVPHRVIYVFDAGDHAPEWLQGTTISVSDPLTIYQAWNIALANVMTRLVMNLNIDDRLAPNAIETMAKEFGKDPEIFLVGGDWKICFTEGDTDNVRPVYSVQELPLVLQWPPMPGAATRLGSGDAVRGTYGPASMWRLEAHRTMPRYPYRFSDGSFIKVIGDALWWNAIERHMGKKLLRLPLIIGNYRSAASSQAEFRYSAAEEYKKQGILFL